MKRWVLIIIIVLLSVNIYADDLISVSGVVTDKDGVPLIGCSVSVKDTSNGTITDLEGKFTLKANKGATVLISYLGYKSQEVKASGNLIVTLEENSQLLNEVVVVGYGTMKRSDVTGSMVSVKGEEMQQTSAATVDQMLQGRAAGIQISGNSGAAGSSTSIQIRGVNSLSSTNEPIYVIDGSIVQSETGNDTYSNPLSELNPNDIESVEILKDASATAIYGAQAANGVIIVNMKKGKTNEAPKVSFKASIGVDNLPKKLDVMDLRQLATWTSGLRGSNVSDYFSNPSVLGKGTDWQDALFRNGIKQEYNLSIRGGKKGVAYSVSGGYFSQEGIVINNDFSRFTLRASVDIKAYSWLDLGVTTNFAHTDKNTGMSQWGVVGNALGQTPNIPVKNADGTWGKSGYNSETTSYQPNPVALASITERDNSVTSNRSLVYATIKPLEWLSWRNEGTIDWNTDNYRYFLPAYDLGGTVRDYATRETSKTYNRFLSFKSLLTGNWKTNGHEISAMLGMEINSRFRDYLYAKRLGGGNSNSAVSSGDATRSENNGWSTNIRYSGFFGRINYNYQDRFLLTATLRRDGSSLFERGNRWGTFPSVGIAWRISEEYWWGELYEIINNLKLRAGFGIVGNSNLADNSYLPTFTTLQSNFGTSYKTANMPNYDGITWEKTRSWNLGLDINFLNNKVEFIFDAYLKDTHDLLLQTALPLFLGTGITGGASPQWANTGSMRNRGVEFTLNAYPVTQKRFKWNTSLTFSLVDNKITSLNNETGFIDKSLSFSTWTETVTRTAVGHSVSQYYGYQVAGRINSAADYLSDNGDGTSTVIAATPNYRVGTIVDNSSASSLRTSIGDLLFKDINGDGIIDSEDRTFLGNGLPDFTFGWNNTFSYRHFSLSIFLYGAVGGKVFNWTRRRMDEPSLIGGAQSNKYTRVVNYAKWGYRDGNSGNDNVWNVYVKDGADPTETRIDNTHNNFNSRVSDRYVESADYLRIKNIVLTYSFPRKIIKPLKLKGLKLSANIQNMYTFTNYSGYDPEVGSQNGQ